MAYGEPMKWSHFEQYFSLRSSGNESNGVSLKKLAEVEKDIVANALAEYETKTEAAEALGISRTMLYKKIKKYDL